MRLNAFEKFKKMVDNKEDFFVNWINYPDSRLLKNENEISELVQYALENGYTRDLSQVKEECRHEWINNPNKWLPQEDYTYTGI